METTHSAELPRTRLDPYPGRPTQVFGSTKIIQSTEQDFAP
jgi:hypothetical protein